MPPKKLKYGPVLRAVMYGVAGGCGVAVDTIIFFIVETGYLIVPIIVLNIFTYSMGTLTSYSINKRFSFKSKTHRLSFKRFYITSIFGMILSTFVLFALTQLSSSLGAFHAKIIATIVAVLAQYFINTKFSLVPG